LDLSVVLPIYNASAFLDERLRLLSGYLESTKLDYELIAVDDGSSDATAAVLSRAAIPRLVAVALPKNRGKYAALAEGMRRSRGNCCLFTDADVPYELEAIPYMVSLVNGGGFHVVIGDRNLEGSRYAADLRWLRRAATAAFTVFVRLFVTSGLFDTQCGLKAFRGEVARGLFPLLREPGFAGDVEALYVALKYNLAIRRIPVRLRRQGPSTVRPVRDGLAMLRAIVRLRSNHRRGAYESAELRRIAAQDYWSSGAHAD
jgi:dolichyl-phosphate beta-glucosyltransferase